VELEERARHNEAKKRRREREREKREKVERGSREGIRRSPL
jgi:hypothetical protein